jgi:hypothetical protein
MEKIMNRLQKILIGAGLLIVVGLIGNSDFEHEQSIDAHYVSNVCNGYWPDYKEINPKCP